MHYSHERQSQTGAMAFALLRYTAVFVGFSVEPKLISYTFTLYFSAVLLSFNTAASIVPKGYSHISKGNSSSFPHLLHLL